MQSLLPTCWLIPLPAAGCRAACDPEVAKKLLAELDAATDAASKVRATLHPGAPSCQMLPHMFTGRLSCWQLPSSPQTLVLRKQPLSAAVLEAAIDNVRGAVMICYPQGLPEWDFVRQCLEGNEDLSGSNVRRTNEKYSSQTRNLLRDVTQEVMCTCMFHVTFISACCCRLPPLLHPASLAASTWTLRRVCFGLLARRCHPTSHCRSTSAATSAAVQPSNCRRRAPDRLHGSQ